METLKDDSLMPFGIHKGTKMANVPADYLLEIVDKGYCNQQVKDYVEDCRVFLETEVKLSKK